MKKAGTELNQLGPEEFGAVEPWVVSPINIFVKVLA